MLQLAPRHLFLASLLISACDCGGSDDNLGTLEPKLVSDPLTVDFGEVTIGEVKSTTVRLTNSGSSVLRISRSTLDNGGSAFTIDRTPPTEISPAQSFELGISFQPGAAGEVTGFFKFESNDKASPYTIEIKGVGIVPRLTVGYTGRACAGDPGSLSVGRVEVGRPTEQTITLDASGDSPVTVESVAIENASSGEWSIMGAPPPGAVIAPGAPITLTLRYLPIDLGPDSATLVVKSNAINKTEIRIGLCGEGIQATLCADPTPLNLGGVIVGTRSTGTVEVTNCGTANIDVSAIRLASDAAHPTHADFDLDATPTLPATFEPGTRFEVSVSFEPTALGAASGFVEVDVGGPKAYVPVVARGVEDCDLLLLPNRLNFGATQVGGQSDRQALIANSSGRACTVLGLTATSSSGYTVVNPPTLPLVIEPGSSQEISLKYNPASGGLPDIGVLRVIGGRNDATTLLVGNAAVGAGCDLEVVPPFINFNAVARGSSATQGVRIENHSATSCNLNGVSLDSSSDPGFIEPTQALGMIAPGAALTVSVTYRPFRLGPASGKLILATNDVDTPEIQVELLGLAPPPSICVSPRQVAFGPTTVPTVLDLTVFGCSAVPVTITDLAFSQPDSEMAIPTPPRLPMTLQPGQQLTVQIRYSPADDIGDTGIIAVGSDDPADPIVYVTVTGGPELAPPEAGRFLYYWQIQEESGTGGANIVRSPLQGALIPQYYWGSDTGQACAGCHTISTDGRYLAVIGENAFELVVIDTEFDVPVTLPFHTGGNTSFISWRPDPNTSPPYQLVYAEGDTLKVASIFGGLIGDLPGANAPGSGQKMATWGPNGQIAFVRCPPSGSWSCYGNPIDIMLIDEGGGTPVPLNGASGNGAANYYPQFSPDGTWIAYTMSVNALNGSTLVASDSRVQLIRPDQSGTIVQLPNLNSMPGDGGNSFPTWSKDGRFLSFSSNRAASLPKNSGEPSWDLYIAPIDPATGTDGASYPVTGANSREFEHAVQWSP